MFSGNAAVLASHSIEGQVARQYRTKQCSVEQADIFTALLPER